MMDAAAVRKAWFGGGGDMKENRACTDMTWRFWMHWPGVVKGFGCAVFWVLNSGMAALRGPQKALVQDEWVTGGNRPLRAQR